MEKTILTSDGLKNALPKFTFEEAIVEYVWNGFDAGATVIRIDENQNLLSGTVNVTIADNGTGICKNELDTKFKPIFQSEKLIQDMLKQDINLKGEKGVGRLSFYNTCKNATWDTVYSINNENFSYSIKINSNDLISFIPSEVQKSTSQTGTNVTLQPNSNISIYSIKAMLQIEFAWFLQIYKNKIIYINGIKLDFDDILAETKSISGIIDGVDYIIDVYIWKRKLNDEYSKYYYIDSKMVVQDKENTTLNNKGDSFYHSVVIKSSLFNNFIFNNSTCEENLLGASNKTSAKYKKLKKIFDEFLYNIRKPYIRTYTKTFISKLKNDGVYPSYDDKNVIDIFKLEQLDDLVSNIYYFEPKIFNSLSKTQKKTMLRMFDLIMNSGEVDGLFKIVGEVVDLTTEERAELAGLLDKTALSNILEMQKLVNDRLQAIQDLKTLIFDENRYVNEVDHIQKFIESHYWIFGEQYHLVTAEEPTFEEALRRFLFILRGEENLKGSIKIDSPDAKKQMDIFAVQQLKSGEIKKVIVVELKRPSVTLKRKELDQVKTYFQTIIKEDRFNAQMIEWEFNLIGNAYNDDIVNEIANSQNHGEKSLAYKINRCKIYVKTWSEIFAEKELDFNWLEEKLRLDQTKLIDKKDDDSDKIINDQTLSSAVAPKEITMAQ